MSSSTDANVSSADATGRWPRSTRCSRVWAIASDDATLPAVLEAVERARAAGATVVASGTAAESVTVAEFVHPVPRPTEPLLAPLLWVLPGQLFSWPLARAKGLDPDEPRGLQKVTLAS